MSTRQPVKTKAVIYPTWYQFKRDLERRLGYNLPNWWWIKYKPKAPLPWNGAHFRATLAALSSLRRRLNNS